MIPSLPYSKTLFKEIDPRELRLGNLVYIRECTSDINSEVIAKHVPMLLTEWWLQRFPNCCYPVEITEQILFDIGFKQDFSFDTFHLPGLHLQKEDSGWYMRLNNSYVNRKPLLNVHQLQNLYFDLTGNEIHPSINNYF
jgi:hypothetical protein